MWNALKNAFKIPELRDRILFTFLALAIFRLGVYIPIPGINTGSSNPSEIIAPVLIATAVSTTVAIVVSKLLQKLPRYQVENYIEEGDEEVTNEES